MTDWTVRIVQTRCVRTTHTHTQTHSPPYVSRTSATTHGSVVAFTTWIDRTYGRTKMNVCIVSLIKSQWIRNTQFETKVRNDFRAMRSSSLVQNQSMDTPSNMGKLKNVYAKLDLPENGNISMDRRVGISLWDHAPSPFRVCYLLRRRSLIAYFWLRCSNNSLCILYASGQLTRTWARTLISHRIHSRNDYVLPHICVNLRERKDNNKRTTINASAGCCWRMLFCRMNQMCVWNVSCMFSLRWNESTVIDCLLLPG